MTVNASNPAASSQPSSSRQQPNPPVQLGQGQPRVEKAKEIPVVDLTGPSPICAMPMDWISRIMRYVILQIHVLSAISYTINKDLQSANAFRITCKQFYTGLPHYLEAGDVYSIDVSDKDGKLEILLDPHSVAKYLSDSQRIITQPIKLVLEGHFFDVADDIESVYNFGVKFQMIKDFDKHSMAIINHKIEAICSNNPKILGLKVLYHASDDPDKGAEMTSSYFSNLLKINRLVDLGANFSPSNSQISLEILQMLAQLTSLQRLSLCGISCHLDDPNVINALDTICKNNVCLMLLWLKATCWDRSLDDNKISKNDGIHLINTLIQTVNTPEYKALEKKYKEIDPDWDTTLSLDLEFNKDLEYIALIKSLIAGKNIKIDGL